MALADSNTYIEPTAGTSLNTARSQYNNSLRSLLTNFKSEIAPSAVNLTAAGTAIGEQAGMLFRSDVTGALYISDPTNVKNSPVGGNFTRTGIGNRVENGIVALAANVATYDIGELVATVSDSGAIAANARVYMKIANAGTMADFVDIGLPKSTIISGYDLTFPANTSATFANATFSSYVGNTYSFADNTGEVGNATARWASGNFTNLTVSDSLIASTNVFLTDSAYIDFGASSDVDILYEGITNKLLVNLHSAATSVDILNAGTATISFNKAGDISAATISGTWVASDSDATTGTSTTKIMTPASTKAAVDAATGLIWVEDIFDFAVDGAQSTVTSAAFEAGFNYYIIGKNIKISSGGLRFLHYKLQDAYYASTFYPTATTAYITPALMTITTPCSFTLTLFDPWQFLDHHVVKVESAIHTSDVKGTDAVSTVSSYINELQVIGFPSGYLYPVYRIKIDASSAMNAGIISVYKSLNTNTKYAS